MKSFQIVAILLEGFLYLYLGDRGNAGQDPQQSWVFNYLSTPLKINAIGERGFELVNLGKSRIVVYQLGCVTIHESSPSIVTVAARKAANIGSLDKEETIAKHVLAERLKCVQDNAKLTVVWVQFDEGAEWVAGRLPVKPTK